MRLKPFPFIVLLIFGSSFVSFAQPSDDEGSVKKTIYTLFKAMETGDSALAHTAFADKVTSATIFRDKSGKPRNQREDSIAGFLVAIGTPHKEVWYEEIWNVKIQIDGDFAQAWCDYAFYVDKNFSHCGVDAFHLFRENDQWKIFHLADTRKKTPCVIPQDIQNKHK